MNNKSDDIIILFSRYIYDCFKLRDGWVYIITVLLNHQRFLHVKLSFKLSFVYVLVLFSICFHMPNAFCLFVAFIVKYARTGP